MRYPLILKIILPLIFLKIPLVLSEDGEPQDNLDDPIVDVETEKMVKFDLLNKLSGKRRSIEIPLGSSHVVHDIRIKPHSCIKEEDSFYGTTYRVPLTIYLEQEIPDTDSDETDDPIELFSGDLTTNPRKDQPPIEHAIYDIILKSCG
jgi:hypothetical protein